MSGLMIFIYYSSNKYKSKKIITKSKFYLEKLRNNYLLSLSNMSGLNKLK